MWEVAIEILEEMNARLQELHDSIGAMHADEMERAEQLMEESHRIMNSSRKRPVDPRDLMRLPSTAIVHIGDLTEHFHRVVKTIDRWIAEGKAPLPINEKSPGHPREWYAGDWQNWKHGMSREEWEAWRRPLGL